MAKVKRSALKWLADNTKSVMLSVVLLTLIGVGISFISMRFALASMNLLDSVTGKSSLGFRHCVAVLAVLIVIQLALQTAYTLYDVRVRARYKNTLQKKLFYTIVTRNYSQVSKIHSGELINRLTSDINTIDSNIVEVIPGVISLISGIMFSFFAMFRLDMYLSIICIALGPLVMVCSALYGKKMKVLYKQCQESDGKTRSFMQECIQNILAVKAFCGEKKAAGFASVLQKTNYKINMKRGYISIIANIMYYIALTAAYYFAVAWCAYKIKAGIMTVGTFTAIVQLVGQVQSPFRDISSVLTKYYETCAAAERIMSIEGIEEDCDGERTLSRELENFISIKAENLSFSYGDEPVLCAANIEIKRGEIAVIKGISGIGKSTFFKLLLGILKPADGSICINCENKSISAGKETRRMFAYVPQGNMILSGSIRRNITFLEDGGDEEKIAAAAKNACIWDFIQSLPGGLDTVIGEKGMGLSEGQVQRIAVARAFFYDAPVILLDEATSALDEKTELEILKNVKSMKNKTCIIITHKKSAESICDREICLSDGKFSI